jgi:hypothetical protein
MTTFHKKDKDPEDPYIPAPRDTSAITLQEEMQALTEALAENTHDVWARGRVEQGWRYGPRRDDIHKEHPGLIPYAQLSEVEKEFDRNTAQETLRFIISLGYCIKKEDTPNP